jgi:GNAT superfamily N-acetyltransferase
MMKLNAYHIRLARTEDLSALPDIEQQANTLFERYALDVSLSEVLTPIEVLRAGLATDRLWVAIDEADRPIGFSLASVVGDNAHIDELDGHPAYGQHGIGKALVETVCAWAQSAGYRAITLTTLRHIPWNAPWYQQLGFRVLEGDELPTPLRDLLHEEIRRGLPADQRVAMRREL